MYSEILCLGLDWRMLWGTSQVPKGRTWVDEEEGYTRLVVVLIYSSAATLS